jgi:hypothetical protein
MVITYHSYSLHHPEYPDMLRQFLVTSILALVSAATAAAAFDAGFVAQYSAAYGGIKVGDVTDTVKIEANRYSIVSESRPTGLVKLLHPGVIHLESRGMIVDHMLQPALYLRIRSDDPKMNERVEFDWQRKTLAMTHKGALKHEPLPDGAQDSLSQAYSFLFLPTLPASVSVPIASSKNVIVYKYDEYPSAPVATRAGNLDVVEYRREPRPGDKDVSIWIKRDPPHFPVQIRIVDGKVSYEQKLTDITPIQ